MGTEETTLRWEVKRWDGIFKKVGDERGVERLRGYMASIALGRNFCEPADTYLERKGLTSFFDWACKLLKEKEKKA